MQFDDDYPSCIETYATLRVFTEAFTPTDITEILGLTPTDSFSRGDLLGSKGQLRRHTGWLFSTREQVNSRDSRRHLSWLLDSLRVKKAALQSLRNLGAELDISCYFLSAGQGGPTIGAEQMAELGQLGLDIWWDIYFDSSGD